jgi:hypothetical protein
VTIKQVVNKTYEPGLEERFHDALSREFIAQGIKVTSEGGDVVVDSVITTFELGALAYIDEKLQEQSIILKADVRITDNEKFMEFRSMQSPIKITFQTTGTVTESIIEKEKATDKACREIAREMISKIIIRYAK